MGGVHRPTVVIPVRPAVLNPPLNLALEQLEHHHPDMVVFLIGHLPRINTTLEVVHIPTVQGRDRFANTDLAMRTALDDPRIPDPFIWSNDDIYWTRPHDPVDWHMGELPTTGTTRYASRKVWTRNILTQHGLPTFDYELHTPTLISKPLMDEALRIGGSMRSIYGNLQNTGTHHADVKVYPGRPIPDGPFLSSHRRTFHDAKRALTDAWSPAAPHAATTP